MAVVNEVTPEREQAFLQDYAAVCRQHGLQLMAVPSLRMLNKAEFMGATALETVAIEGWVAPQQESVSDGDSKVIVDNPE